MEPTTSLSEVSIRVGFEGYVFIPRFRPNEPSPEAFNAIGQIDHLPGLRPIQELKPTPMSDSGLNTYSGNFGLGAFPFHSDMAHWPTPPRFLALRCIKGAKDVKTRVLDTLTLAEAMGTSRLKRTLVKPRRPLEMTFPLMRLLEQKQNGRHVFRWDSIFMIAASPQSILVCDEVEKWVATRNSIDVVLFDVGDTLIVDNWRMLHSRNPVPTGAEERLIHRAYFSELK